MIQGLNFILNHVDDIAAARAFYTEKMGFTVETDLPDFVQFAQSGGATYAIARTTPTESGTELWWFVDDADATHAALAAKGVETVTPPHDEPFGRAFAVKDPAGNILSMLQLPARG
ncbi:MAG TPA: VOC family protein [Chloroflexota bacterium]|nr:VOC family protein [Chloroflexota bacterium]